MPKARILIVEDESLLRKEIMDTLRFEGYEAIGAIHGLDALEQIHAQLPDLIISDIMMPELDGYGLLMAIRDDIETRLIPFIFLTAKNEYNELRKGMGIGADDYLIKPFETDDLLHAVEARLKKHSQMDDFYERKMQNLRSSITTYMPHELRTPLTSILGYIDLLIHDFDELETEQMLRMLRSMQKAGNRLHRTIQNYLLFTQLVIVGIDEEKVALLATYQDLKSANPVAVVERVANEKAKTYQRQGDLIIDVKPGAVNILQEDFAKVLEEVVDNAFKFSPAGKPVIINGKTNGTHYYVSVVDQGRGMSAAQIDEIDAFIQFNRAIHEQQGAGLGLIITKKLMEIYCGEVSIASRELEGTEVTLSFKIPPK